MLNGGGPIEWKALLLFTFAPIDMHIKHSTPNTCAFMRRNEVAIYCAGTSGRMRLQTHRANKKRVYRQPHCRFVNASTNRLAVFFVWRREMCAFRAVAAAAIAHMHPTEGTRTIWLASVVIYVTHGSLIIAFGRARARAQRMQGLLRGLCRHSESG